MKIVNNPVIFMSDRDYEIVTNFCSLLVTDLSISDADLRQLIEGFAEGDKDIYLWEEEIAVTINTDGLDD